MSRLRTIKSILFSPEVSTVMTWLGIAVLSMFGSGLFNSEWLFWLMVFSTGMTFLTACYCFWQSELDKDDSRTNKTDYKKFL